MYKTHTPQPIMLPFWSLASEKALAALHSQAEGLTETEAKRRLCKYGPNLVRQKPPRSRLQLLLEQCQNPLIIILLVAAIITIGLGEVLETIVILSAVGVNATLGFWQEYKAQTVLTRLASYIRTRTLVRRKNHEYEVDSADVIPGDVVRLSQGDRVPADGRWLFTNTVRIDESVLTGESLPVDKDAAAVDLDTILAERSSMAYEGTLVVEGFGDMLVTATNEHTEFGKIAVLTSQSQAQPTPLQTSINTFARTLGWAVGVMSLALFLIGLIFGHHPLDMFLIAVAVAVSVVPEGLPIALTVILAVGVERLAKKQGVVRKLLAAETLGSTTVILTDKTGTLTQARMTLTEVISHTHHVSDSLLRAAVLNMDITLENPNDAPAHWRLIGRPMDTALIRDAATRGVLLPQELARTKILARLPFHSRHKYSLTLAENHQGRQVILMGAPEIILPFTTLSPDEQGAWHLQIQKRAASGERLLGVAIKPAKHNTLLSLNEPPRAFAFLGLLAFRDPVRPHVKDAIARIEASGVRTVMITGDHPGTASAIGQEVGLWQPHDTILNSEDLRRLSPTNLTRKLATTRIFARVTPEQKLDIVRLFQARGHVVAVTGDGVNDAPALEAADIGVAVGSGTDVAKSAADLVILDDNFETIVLAIEEGRRILGNIRKVIIYLLSNTVDSLLLIGGSLIIGLPIPLNALQILFVNFFSDSFPALAFAFEQHSDHLVPRRSPTTPPAHQTNLFTKEMRVLILVLGISTSVLLFALYVFLLRLGFAPALVHTFVFASFATYTLLMTFSLRSLTTSILTYNPFSNVPLTAGVAIGVGLTLLAVYVPALQQALSTVALPLPWLLGVLGVGVLNVCGVEFVKWLTRTQRI